MRSSGVGLRNIIEFSKTINKVQVLEFCIKTDLLIFSPF